MKPYNFDFDKESERLKKQASKIVLMAEKRL
jgi:hypothetical protein